MLTPFTTEQPDEGVEEQVNIARSGCHGEQVSRDQLLQAVWEYDRFPLTRTVDMHITKLGQKIEETPSEPRYIMTVHRVGYKFIG